MSVPFADANFVSFDGSEKIHSKLYFPDRFRVLESIFKDSGNFAVQGANLSYAPLSFGAGSSSVRMTQFNRLLSFDEGTGIIEVEAGITLGQLAVFSIPRNWYLKVQPGHPSITVGGCLGADVHGKNQFLDLNFKEQVLFLRLYHPEMGFIYCDRETHSELFHLTCGGFGLSGIVISLGIQLGQLKSRQVDTETLQLESIDELPKLLTERSSTEDLLYSWHNFNNMKTFGAGFLKVGRLQKLNDPDSQSDATKDFKSLLNVKPLTAEARGSLPVSLLNRMTVPIMNRAYASKELKQKTQTVSLANFLFPVLDKTIYFDLFGQNGFYESQVLIPFDHFSDVMRELKRILSNTHVPVTLASCKLFKGRQELLRFIGDGIVLAFNLPQCSEALAVLRQWDEVVKETKCLPNLSKDSRLPLEVVQSCYPEYEEFKTRLYAWDSDRLFKTSLSKRLQL